MSVERILPAHGFVTRDGSTVYQCDECVVGYNAMGVEGGCRNLRRGSTIHLTPVIDSRRPVAADAMALCERPKETP